MTCSFHTHTPPLLQKVLGDYLGLNIVHFVIELGIWELLLAVTFLVARVNPKDSSFKFQFIKNGNQNNVKKMPIHSMVCYAYALEKVIIMLEDMWKKQQVNFICLVSSLNDELMSSSMEKGFTFKGLGCN